MIRTGRERRLRRKIRLLKQAVGVPDKREKVEKKPLPVRLTPVVNLFQEEDEKGNIKIVSAEKMKHAYQGGRPNIKELMGLGFSVRKK